MATSPPRCATPDCGHLYTEHRYMDDFCLVSSCPCTEWTRSKAELIFSLTGDHLTVGEALDRLKTLGVLQQRTFHAPVQGAGYPRWFETEWEWSEEPWDGS